LEGRIHTSGRINAFQALASLLAPTGLTATADPSGSIVTLTWTDNATGEDGYTVERKTGADPYVQIATVATDVTTYTDTTASGNTTYTYRVTAFNALPATSGSAEATVTTPTPPEPQGGAGGGCTIGARQNTASALANTAVLFLPLLVLALSRNIRRRKK
jgi:hypothetical protein